jgi:assimilatory nitrate reductase catalytic subunit
MVRSLFESGAFAAPVRRIVYAGPTADAAPEDAPLICACFGVRLSAIREAIAAGDAVTVADIGRTLRAGTNCGSCVPELKGIIERLAREPVMHD